MSTVKPSAIISGLMVITPDVHQDERGRFACFHDENYRFTDQHGKPLAFVEDSLSSSKKNVLRGLHGDDRTWKLMQVAHGRVFLAVVDLRRSSPTYLKTETFELDAESFRQVLIPAGCVNGHLCLSDGCALIYKQSEKYGGREGQRTVAWNDPRFAIAWPVKSPILSARDQAALPWKES